MGPPDVERSSDANKPKTWQRNLGGGEGKRNIYFKELAHMVVKVIKSEIYKVGQRPRNSSRISVLQS